MRSRPLPIQAPEHVEVDLAERLRATAAHLEALPARSARSLSVTAGWQGWGEAQIRRTAAAIAAPLGFVATVEPDGDVVTVIFRRRDPLD
jgi:hypothetical protein